MSTFQSNKSYTDEVFKNINFTDKELSDTEFEECKFTACTFSDSSLNNCKFIDCEFEKCNLNLVKINEVSLVDVIFKNSKLSGIDFSGITGLTRSMDFIDCNMKYAIFSDIDLSKRKFKNSTIHESSFMEVNLGEADFSGSDLRKTRFEDCDLRKADFRNAKNYFINTHSNKIAKAKFSMPEAASLLKNLDIITD